MEGRFCPPPDLRRLINNLLPTDPHSTCLALDDNQNGKATPKMMMTTKMRSNQGVLNDGKTIINTTIKTRMRTIKTRMTMPKKTMKATGKTTSKASNLTKVNGRADTRMIRSGPITDGII
jgi:hypothetical protein